MLFCGKSVPAEHQKERAAFHELPRLSGQLLPISLNSAASSLETSTRSALLKQKVASRVSVRRNLTLLTTDCIEPVYAL